MTIQLKAKHFFMVANLLQTQPLNRYFDLISNLKQALAGKALEDTVSVTATATQLIEIYTMLGNQTENLMNMPNTEMKTMLMPQVQAGVMAGDGEWVQVYQYITGLEQANATQRDQLIGSGKTFLGL